MKKKSQQQGREMKAKEKNSFGDQKKLMVGKDETKANYILLSLAMNAMK